METLQRTANRGSISTGYDIDNSLKFEPDNSESLKWTNISTYATSARKKTFSFSVWFKITELEVQRTIWATSANGYLLLQADGQLKWQQSYGGAIKTLNTNRLFRDTSAWYNVIIAVDTTQSIESNRQRLYVNGVEETSLTSTTYPSQNAEAENVYQDHHYLGAYTGNQIYWAGYMANVAFISDAQITPSDVGEFDEDTGIWKPKEYSGGSAPSYFLEFKDSSDLGAATGLDADTLTNITAADQATDTPTNSFCIFNPTFSWIYSGNDASATILNGGTTADNIALTPGTAWKGAVGTMAVNKGKWYWEWENNGGAFGHRTHGILTTEFTVRSVYAADDYSNQLVFRDGGTPRIVTLIDGTVATPHYMTPYTAGSDVYAIALNMDDEEATFYRNGTAITIDGTSNTTIDISSVDGVSKYVYPLYSCYGSSDANYNFGGYTVNTISSGNSDENGYGNFEYAPPSGYYALCTKNLAEFG